MTGSWHGSSAGSAAAGSVSLFERDALGRHRVKRPDEIGKRVRVWVVDWCGCRGRKDDGLDTRLIDLAPCAGVAPSVGRKGLGHGV